MSDRWVFEDCLNSKEQKSSLRYHLEFEDSDNLLNIYDSILNLQVICHIFW